MVKKPFEDEDIDSLIAQAENEISQPVNNTDDDIDSLIAQAEQELSVNPQIESEKGDYPWLKSEISKHREELKQNPSLAPIVKIGGDVARSVGYTMGKVFEPVTKPIVEGVTQHLSRVVPEGEKQFVKDVVSGGVEAYRKAIPNEGTRDVISSVGAIAGAALGAKDLGIGESTKGLVKAAGKTAEDVAKKINPDYKAVLREGVDKGIKPSVVGKGTFSKKEKIYENTDSAVKSIIKNKENLKHITDENGEVISPENYKTEQFSQAIESTKKEIYNKYNSMSVAAGNEGATVKIDGLLNDLEKMSKGDLGRSPGLRNYAAQLKDELTELNGASPDVVERRIAELNSSLEGYFKGTVTKGKAEIDAGAANKLREALDNSIMDKIGEGYQDLKNEYGALKAIEKEVNHRATVLGRRAKKNMFDLVDPFALSEVGTGVVTMNPGLVLKGLATYGLKQHYKVLNDPDRYIKRMFNKASKEVESEVVTLVAPKPITDKNRLLPYQMVGENSQPIPKETLVNGQRTVKTDMKIPVGSKIRNLGESGAPEFDYKAPPVKPVPPAPKAITDRSAKALPPPMIGKATQEVQPAIASRAQRAREIDRRVAELGKVEDLKGERKLTTFSELATRHKDPFNYGDPDATAKPATEPHIYSDDPRVKDLLSPAEYRKLVKSEEKRIAANKDMAGLVEEGDMSGLLTPEQYKKKSLMEYEKHMSELNAPKTVPEVEKKSLVSSLVKKLGVSGKEVVFKDLSTDKKQVILDLVNRLNSSKQAWDDFYDRGILDKPFVKGESNIHQDDIVDLINSVNLGSKKTSMKNIRTK